MTETRLCYAVLEIVEIDGGEEFCAVRRGLFVVFDF